MLERSSCREVFADEADGRIRYTAWLNFGTRGEARATDHDQDNWDLKKIALETSIYNIRAC